MEPCFLGKRGSRIVLERVKGDKIYLMVKNEDPIEITPGSDLKAEILEAYEIFFQKHPISPTDEFILELLREE